MNKQWKRELRCCKLGQLSNSFTVHLSRSLYSKYSESLTYYFIRDIDQILDNANTPSTIKYADVVHFHHQQQHLNKYLKSQLALKKRDVFTKTARLAYPRIYSQPQYGILSDNHARHSKKLDRRTRKKSRPQNRLLQYSKLLNQEELQQHQPLQDRSDCLYGLRVILSSVFKDKSQRYSYDFFNTQTHNSLMPIETPDLSTILHQPEVNVLTQTMISAFKKKQAVQKNKEVKNNQNKLKKRKETRPKRASLQLNPNPKSNEVLVAENMQLLKKKIREMKLIQLNRQSSTKINSIKLNNTPCTTGINTKPDSYRINQPHLSPPTNLRQTLLTVPDIQAVSVKKAHIRTASAQSIKQLQVRKSAKHKYASSQICTVKVQQKKRVKGKKRGQK